MKGSSIYILSIFVFFTIVLAPTNAWQYTVLYISDYNENYNKIHTMYNGAGILYSQRSTYYRNYESDAITITTASSRRIMLNFERLAVESNSYGCHDRIMIYDGQKGIGNLLTPSSGLCGSQLPRMYYSSGNTLYIQFITDSSRTYTGFKLLFTSFMECNASSVSGKFKCDNNFCIDDFLVEDNHNNCGDNSDEYGLTAGEIVGIVFGALFGVLIMVGLFVMCVKESKGRRKARTAMPANSPHVVPVNTYNNVAYATNQQVAFQPSGVAAPPPSYFANQPPPPPAYIAT
ncbi:uncharacterized protein LOC117100789 [Anneissia japonica]|uniref:uncharacterized protein LOC117100789 n=1 Tax=Anneissia japonica TaxID=1529436 RepID=UPI001425AC1B|nr:uncharacterized protein LOC117100789 [Anneissia japonica]